MDNKSYILFGIDIYIYIDKKTKYRLLVYITNIAWEKTCLSIPKADKMNNNQAWTEPTHQCKKGKNRAYTIPMSFFISNSSF